MTNVWLVSKAFLFIKNQHGIDAHIFVNSHLSNGHGIKQEQHIMNPCSNSTFLQVIAMNLVTQMELKNTMKI